MKILLAISVSWASSLAIAATADTPYAGQETREIKALSPDDIKSYLSGSGMGFAKTAELNHYPGPRHVLDLSERLGLSSDQIARTQHLFDALNREARELGRQVVEEEQQLDQLFAASKIDSTQLRGYLERISALQAKLRYVHLHAHLEQRAILTAEQVRHYDELRGYDKPSAEASTQMHGHHH